MPPHHVRVPGPGGCEGWRKRGGQGGTPRPMVVSRFHASLAATADRRMLSQGSAGLAVWDVQESLRGEAEKKRNCGAQSAQGGVRML